MKCMSPLANLYCQGQLLILVLRLDSAFFENYKAKIEALKQ